MTGKQTASRKRPAESGPVERKKRNPNSVLRRNARERDRIRNVNDAFDALRTKVPNGESIKGRKISKVETLKSAIEYINALRDILGDECKPVPIPDDSEDEHDNDSCIADTKPIIPTKNTKSNDIKKETEAENIDEIKKDLLSDTLAEFVELPKSPDSDSGTSNSGSSTSSAGSDIVDNTDNLVNQIAMGAINTLQGISNPGSPESGIHSNETSLDYSLGLNSNSNSATGVGPIESCIFGSPVEMTQSRSQQLQPEPTAMSQSSLSNLLNEDYFGFGSFGCNPMPEPNTHLNQTNTASYDPAANDFNVHPHWQMHNHHPNQQQMQFNPQQYPPYTHAQPSNNDLLSFDFSL